MANFKPNTRYTNGIITTSPEGEQFLVLRKPLVLAEDSGDVFVTITQDLINRPDLIAYKAYKDPELWWVIMEFNGITDPLFDLTAGTTLRIPEYSRVIEAIKNLGTV